MWLRTAALCVVLVQTPEPRTAGQHMFSANSGEPDPEILYLTVGSYESISPVLASSLEGALAEDLALIGEIRHVLVEHVEGHLLVWIAADNPSRLVRERIFQKELSLIDGFPEVEFDFNVVSSATGEGQSIASNAKVIFSRGR